MINSIKNTLIWPYHIVVRTGSISVLTSTSAIDNARMGQLI